MKKITIEEVEHLAELSALSFTDEEKNKFIDDFSSIIEMVNQLQEAPTSNESVFNKSHKLCELREDEVKESYLQEEILENAPKARRGCFNVPLVVE